MSGMSGQSSETGEAAVRIADESRRNRKQRLSQLKASAAEIKADLEVRRAELSGLAEDGPAFRSALEFISAEEDRERALRDVVIPQAEAELGVAEDAFEDAAGALARIRAIADLERMFTADQSFSLALQALARALEECERVRAEIRETVHHPRSKIRKDALDIAALNWCLPGVLRGHFSRFPFGNGNVVFKPDIVAWQRDRLGIVAGEVSE